MYYLLTDNLGHYCITDLSIINCFDTGSIQAAVDTFYDFPYSFVTKPTIRKSKFYCHDAEDQFSYTIITTSTQLDFTPQSHPELYI